MERDDRSRRQDLTTESSDEEEVQVDHIKVGSYYEIDHSKLPRSSPVQLQMVKIVMVCGKNERLISVRYPSIFSLKSYFRSGNSGPNGSRAAAATKMQKATKLNPALDEKYSMVNRVAAMALFRRIKPEDFVESRGLMAFWAAGGQSVSVTRKIATRSSLSGEKVMAGDRGSGGGGSAGVGGGSELMVYHRNGRSSKSGDCLLALKSGNVARWGKRQKVRYISKGDHCAAGDDADGPRVITPPNNEDKSAGEEQLLKEKEQSDDESSEDGKNEEENENEKQDEVKEEVKEDHEDDEDDKSVSDEEVKPAIPLRRNGKRKCKVLSYNQNSRIPKKQKRETIVRRKLSLTRGQIRRGHKVSINRWSADRYNLAEENMLKIMKEKGAIFEKPMLRQKLRDEARKVIGDTGLLDHLLKHMAGKVAPGGEERFRRRHNAEGAMEYWLESADLVEIRKMAGVSDPYWKPPPGWKLGDNPSQDPICAVEIKQLKEEVDKLKRDISELQMTKGQSETDIAATTPLSCVSEHSLASDLEALPLKELHEELVKRKFRLQQQMIMVSQYLTEMEEGMKNLSKVQKATKEGSEGTAGCLTLGSENSEAAEGNNHDKGKSQTQLIVMDIPMNHNKVKGQSQANPSPAEEAAAAAKAEEKTAKIQRLKSGFRICKPQGSFKWPNMAAAGEPSPVPHSSSSISSSSSQMLSPPTNYEYILAAQTPPSVSSTTNKSPSLPLTQPTPMPMLPVKPLARRLSSAVAIPIPSYLPTLIDLNYALAPPAKNNFQTDSTEHYVASHSQRNDHALAMIPRGSSQYPTNSVSRKSSTLGIHNHLRSPYGSDDWLDVQVKYSSMSPRLEAEKSRLVAYADEKQLKRTSYSANTSPAAENTNTWVAVPIPNPLLCKSNQ